MKKLRLTMTVLLLLANGVAAQEGLYEGEVLIPGQSQHERNEAIPAALIQVLQKLTGQRELPVSPELDQALGHADRLLHSFRYRNVNRTGSDGVVVEELRLVARFIPSEVDTLVQQLGLPRWQQQRPGVQIWVVIDDGSSRKLKPVEFAYAWEAIEDIASSRGLPVSWPKLDEEKVQLMDLRLIWGGFTDYLIEWGAPADGVVIVAARREGAQWSLRWNMTAGEHRWHWRNIDRELKFALLEGIHQMVDQLASANAIAPSEQRQWAVKVSVSALDSVSDYVRCFEFLQSLSLVTSVGILGAEPGRVYFNLQLNASPEYLNAAFSRSSLLMASASSTDFEYEFSH